MGNCAKDKQAYRVNNNCGLDAYNNSLPNNPRLQNSVSQNMHQQDGKTDEHINMHRSQSAIIRKARSQQNNENTQKPRQFTITVTEPNSKSDSQEMEENVESTGRVRKGSVEERQSSKSSYLSPQSRAYIAGLQVISEASLENSIRKFDLESEAERRQQMHLPYTFPHVSPYRLHSQVVKGESNHQFGPTHYTTYQWRYQF